MKAFLMYRDKDVDSQQAIPKNAGDLVNDLELDRLFDAMGAGDDFLRETAKASVLSSLRDPSEIRYRQQVLSDCLQQPQSIRQVYLLAVEAIERERKIWGSFGRYPDSTLNRSVDVLELFVPLLKQLREIAERAAQDASSEGLERFFRMLMSELNDGYITTVEEHLERLNFKDGVRISAILGKGNKGTDYVLRMPPELRNGWKDRLRRWAEKLSLAKPARLFYQVSDRDEAGMRALGEMKGRGISTVAIALTQSTDHILEFFKMLRAELGFYVGCLNLYDRLAEKGEHVCIPVVQPADTLRFSARGMYDACLSLGISESVVANDVEGDKKKLTLITGANRGGKSTLLRSIGLCQSMAQCGMFVPADSLEINVQHAIFTHFKREEDASMRSGKLDEELHRMSLIADQLSVGSMVLFNESFGSTNEREGSEIARQIVRALLERGIKICFVTHMFDLAESFYRMGSDDILFLRAERLESGARTFRLVEGAPLPTSFGEDLYRQIFDEAP